MCKIQTYQILQYVQSIKFPTQEAVRRQPDQVFAFNRSISYWWRLDWHKHQPDIPPGSILMWTAPWSSTSSPLTSRSQQWSVCLFLRWPGWQSNSLQWWCWCRCVKWRSPPSPSLLRCRLCLQLETKTWIEFLPINNNTFVQALRLEWLDDSESYFGDETTKLSIFEHTVFLQQVTVTPVNM